MKYPARLSFVLSPLLLSTGCSFPGGSYARPVEPIAGATTLVSGGVMVPFAAAGSAFDGQDDVSFSGVAESVLIIPAGAFDYVFEGDERSTFGVEVWAISGDLSTSGGNNSDYTGIFVNPRYEYRFSRYAGLTIDGNLGYVGANNTGVPFFSPTVGIRTYLPLGHGGLMLSQQLGTSGVTVTMPGSFAVDLPIPLGKTSAVHIMPEIRWDPTALLIDDSAGIVVVFSAGGTLMFEF